MLNENQEDLFNLKQLAEVTLAAGRLRTTNVCVIKDYIKNAELNKPLVEMTFPTAIDGICQKEERNEAEKKYLLYVNRTKNRGRWSQKDITFNFRIEDNQINEMHSSRSKNFETTKTLICANFCARVDDKSNLSTQELIDITSIRCLSPFSSGDHRSLFSCNDRFAKSALYSSGKSLCSHSTVQEDHKCLDCGKKYSTSSNLGRHRQTHRSIMDKKARHCPQCNKIYVSMAAFSMHLRTHNQRCECPHCGKCFSRQWLLQGHLRTHTGEKPFRCAICSKAFADKSNLRAHTQTHSNSKPHVCAKCGKAFALKSYLYKHEESSCTKKELSSGVEHGNLRELALACMRDLGTTCRDVRTREVGIQEIHNKVRPYEAELVRRDYVANGGWETFLSYEDPEQDILVGLLRLRKCSDQTYRPELQNRCSVVREFHVYGSVVPVNSRDPTKFQHQGFGTLLMEEAERISRKEHGSIKLAVISGVGTRNYYRKMGYELDGPYMTKMLN